MPGDFRNRSPRPALVELGEKQRDLADRLRDGFDEFDEWIYWLHDWVFWSLGNVENELINDLTVGLRFSNYGPILYKNFISEYQDRDWSMLREEFLKDVALPPMAAAYRSFWSDATEYVDGPPDPEREEFRLMRAGLTELKDQQRSVLRRGIEGFEDGVEWKQELIEATLGEFDEAVVSAILSPVAWEGPLWPVGTEEYAGRAVQALGCGEILLPWFAGAIRKQAVKSPEKPSEKEKEPERYEIAREDLSENGSSPR